MNLQDAKERIKKLEVREVKLKQALASAKSAKDDIITLLKLSSIFDESLIQIISELITTKEQEKYVPFIYNKYNSFFASSAHSSVNSCVGIAKEEYIPKFMQTDAIDNLFKQGYGYNMICINTEVVETKVEDTTTYVSLYDLNKEYSNKFFTFKFLLKEIDESEMLYPVRICETDFENFNYVQEFIRHIFDLQVQRCGSRLKYDELKEEMKKFLLSGKENGKSKGQKTI